jgi:hypothetical protein
MTNYATGLDVAVCVDNPNWRYKLAKHQDASNPYTRKGGSAHPVTISCESKVYGSGNPPAYQVVGSTLWHGIPPTPSTFASTDSALADIAVTRLKRKIQQSQGDIHAMVPLAELHEMRGLISGSADLATRLMRDLINIKRSRGRSAVRYASKAWLNFQFGVNPLIQDTRAVSQAIADYLLRQNHYKVYRAGAKKQFFSSDKGQMTGDVNANIDYVTRMSHELSYQYTAAVDVQVTSGNNYGAMAHFHVGFEELPSVLWELTPYSWVVDYFTTAGDFLEDVFSTNPGATTYCVESRKYTCHAKFDVEFHPMAASVRGFKSSTGASGAWNYYEFERSPKTTIPRRILRLKTVDEIGIFGVKKLLNLAAVLAK